jgi:hypothetical protein
MIVSLAALSLSLAVAAEPGAPLPQPAEARAEAQPSAPPPSAPPEIAPARAPAPAPAVAAPAAAVPAPAGQWAHTSQYGWVWMPVGDVYWYAPPTARGAPYAYVFRPAVGWAWVPAPWIWGVGPWPRFTVAPVAYGWYARAYWRTPWRYAYRPAPVRGVVVFHGVRPVPVARVHVHR